MKRIHTSANKKRPDLKSGRYLKGEGALEIMPSYTISSTHMSDADLTGIYQACKIGYREPLADLDIIFSIALRERSLFPPINLRDVFNEKQYLSRWVKNYVDAMNNPPSMRTANPKTACSDPAIKTIVQQARGFSDVDATLLEQYHNLFMSAENIQGNLLEEYISRQARPYGWLWCAGNVLHAVDFCNTTGTVLLQVKNKSNTENSSSRLVRAGTKIEKWYRLGTRKQNGHNVPHFKWTLLNHLVNYYRTDGLTTPYCTMNEGGYRAFLSAVAAANRGIITEQ